MRPRTLATSVLCLALYLPCRASAAGYRCPKSNYDVNLAVLYANGMFSSLDRASANLEALRPLVANRLGHDPYAIAFGLAYNGNESPLPQLWSVAWERFEMTPSRVIRVLNDLVPAPDWLANAIKKYAAEVDQVAFIDDQDLEQQVQTYRDHLRKGRQVVVVAHSQGNLYANAAYRRLFETSLPTPGQASFGIVSVGTPAPVVAGWAPPSCPSGCYTTFAEDALVAVVRAIFPDTLPDNISGRGQTPEHDLLWHGFRESYLHIDASRTQILDHVQAFVNQFEPLAWTIHDAMITASLEWDSDADLDLHVYENDGSEHVYYAYPAGKAGYLDADDHDGYGPENYYADCGYVQPGSFRFAVGYWNGSGPVTVRLRVQAGNLTETFTRVLDTPQGRASHTEPTTLAWLEIASTGHDEYELLLSAER